MNLDINCELLYIITLYKPKPKPNNNLNAGVKETLSAPLLIITPKSIVNSLNYRL